MNISFFFELVGLFGGILLGVDLVPQVYHTIVSNSTKDISLLWQFLHLLGLSMLYTYSIYFNLWSIYIPGSLEIISILILIFYKIKNDGCFSNNNDKNQEV